MRPDGSLHLDEIQRNWIAWSVIAGIYILATVFTPAIARAQVKADLKKMEEQAKETAMESDVEQSGFTGDTTIALEETSRWRRMELDEA